MRRSGRSAHLRVNLLELGLQYIRVRPSDRVVLDQFDGVRSITGSTSARVPSEFIVQSAMLVPPAEGFILQAYSYRVRGGLEAMEDCTLSAFNVQSPICTGWTEAVRLLAKVINDN